MPLDNRLIFPKLVVKNSNKNSFIEELILSLIACFFILFTIILITYIK